MRKFFLASVLILCFVLTAYGSVFAAAVSPDVDYDVETGLLTVSGEAKAETLVTLMLLKHGVVFDDTNKNVSADDILYFDTVEPTDGVFAFELEFPGTAGIYQASIVNSKSGVREAFAVTMVDPEIYPTAISAVNGAADDDFDSVFKPVFEANKTALGFEYNPDVTDDALKLFQNYIEKNNLKVDEYEKNLKLYYTFCVIGALNNKSISDIVSHIDSLYFESEDLKDDYISITEVSGASTAATAKMSGKKIKTLDDFYDKFIAGMVLGATEHTQGVNKLMALLSTYGKDLGITKSITHGATASINGKEYETAEALVKAYNYYEVPKESGGASGGSGGGTSMSGNSMSSTSVKLPGEQAGATVDNPVNALYHDIEGYKWATTAIIALTDMGIVNGNGNGMFVPEDNVLREEFAKILVGALGETPSINNTFTDVSADAWYCGWVNRAAELGICQGIGNDAFGIGQNITREDMCQMIVNALRYKGCEVAPVELAFSDEDAISDYAKQAVETLYGMGAVNGVSETMFAPKEFANRAQAAKIIYSVLKFLR